MTVNTDNVNVRCYSPFGFLHTGDSIDASSAFNGSYHEPATQTYLLGNGYRAFNPLLMRFHSPDSFSPFGAGGLNAYAYVGNDPTNRIDPSGHFGINPAKLFRRLFKGSKQTSVLIGTANDNIPIKVVIYDVTEAGLLGPEAIWFTKYRKGIKTLFIDAHGANGKISLSKNYAVEAKELVRNLKLNNILPGNYKRIHLISCRLGAGSAYSFANELHDLTGLTVKSYNYDLLGSNLYGKIREIIENSPPTGSIRKIPVKQKLVIFKIQNEHIRHAQKIQPGQEPLELYSPRTIR